MTNVCDGDGREAIFKEAGRRAREEVRAITRMAEAMRLTSFRAYLASVIDIMPTILPDMSSSVGLPLTESLQRLRPYAHWPTYAGRNVAPPTPKRLPLFATLGRRITATTDVSDVYAHPLRIGTALLSDGALTDWVEIIASGRWLEISMRSDAFALATHEGTAQLKLPGLVPEVLLSTCAGQPLNDVVDHPLLRDRSVVIDSARLVGSQTVLQFRLGGSPVAFPWRD
ncbi:hypothetical protein [Sphingomonas beigongshangi]|uniref:hypothetical protein n=1 Tax=Sphingomonas beigongshangi TaxID=2782540 RepID=UPI001AEEB2E7|nr:hypothetical protein [Sphingomonas beigongshangi]